MKTACRASLAASVMVIAACSHDLGRVTQPVDPLGFATFLPALDSVAVGDTARFYAYTRDSQPVSSWTVSDSRVATILQTSATSVGSTALMRTLHQGTATVTATKGDSTASGVLVVVSVPPAAALTVTPSVDTACAGNSATFTAAVRDSLGNQICCQSVTWSVSDTSVARLFSTAGATVTVGAAKAGSATVVATSAGKSDSAQFVVIAPTPAGLVASVTVTPAPATVAIGSCVLLVATLRDAYGTLITGPVTWFVGDTSVASIVRFYVGSQPPPRGACSRRPVSQAVLIGGRKAGVTDIAATSGGKTGTAQVFVPPPPPVATVTVGPTPDTAIVGDSGIAFTATLRDAQGNFLGGRVVTWAVSDTSVARLQSSGGQTASFRALKAGSTVVTATSEGQSGAGQLVVQAVVPIGSLTLNPTSASPVAGDGNWSFTATLRDSLGNPITGRAIQNRIPTWAVSDTSVAGLSDLTGFTTGVFGLKAGSATLTATCAGKTATAQLTVLPPLPVASVSVSPSSATMRPGDSVVFTATTLDAQGATLTGRPVTWSVSDSSIARMLNSSGSRASVLGLKTGQAMVAATSEGKSGTVPVVVTLVASVTVSPAFQDTLAVGDSAAFTATPRDALGNPLSGPSVTWSVSDTTVAGVLIASGLTTWVRALKAGSTILTATSETRSGSVILIAR